MRQKVLLALLMAAVLGMGLSFWLGHSAPPPSSSPAPPNLKLSNSGYQAGDEDPAWTSLHLAARQGDTAKIEDLPAGDPSLEAADSYGRTPLHLAAQEGQRAAAEALIKQKASLEARDRWGNTPLHWAVRGNHPDLVELLITAGADANAKNASGDAPLLVAALYGNVALLQMLIDNGADADADSRHGYNPLDLALAAGKNEAADLLRRSGATPITRTTEVNKSWLARDWMLCSLCRAAASGDLLQAQAILDRDQDAVKAKDTSQHTPLHLAAMAGQVEMIKLLLANGADVSIKGPHGATPLYYAAQYGQIEAMAALIEAGADVNLFDGYGLTPMHATSMGDEPKAVDFLVDHGGDVNAANDVGKNWTPLIYAARDGALLVGAAMIKRGADLEACTANGRRTALVMALQYNQPEFADLLLAMGAKPLPPAYPIPGAGGGGGKPKPRGTAKEIQDRLNQGEDVNTRDDKGRSLLYLAAADGNRKAVELLLGKGADVNLSAGNGKAPLHIAVINNHIDVVGLLLKNGANPNLKDKDGSTPMDYARSLKRDGFVELLSKYKAE